jgi:hypothetical protein
METSLTHIADGLETKGNEETVTRLKKVKQIRRAVEIIKNVYDDKYLELAEDELGELPDTFLGFEKVEGTDTYRMIDNETAEQKEFREKVYARSQEIADSEWEELWKIFQGQNYNAYTMLVERMTVEERRKRDHWKEWFNGSDLRGWWD